MLQSIKNNSVSLESQHLEQVLLTEGWCPKSQPLLFHKGNSTFNQHGQDENSRFVFTEIRNGETPNVYSSISTFLVLSTCAWSVSKRKILSVWLYYRSTNSSCFQFREGFADIVFVPWWGFVQWRGHLWSVNASSLVLFVKFDQVDLVVFELVVCSAIRLRLCLAPPESQ